ncbi:O-fucosyltransferase family protein [Rhynchospora pubera]|uniref:O-fucosyltransferase family protein n=1 Tax=Rhynchospora pubera TaxID=906938 RepID=A0AAV8DLK9_9POAL|nr:O-fucosyltransferase family protein [Rhynchospora pubera]KAJ4782036.1 O-fucosyltransferase family protein [Rhynchospora pubera]
MLSNRKSSHRKRKKEIWKQLRLLVFAIGLILLFIIIDSVMVSTIPYFKFPSKELQDNKRRLIQEEIGNIMYGRLLSLASSSLTKNNTAAGQFSFLEESAGQTLEWTPCAGKPNNADQGHGKKHNGYILVSANGGLNQQRVAVCNAVAIASLLNATLVLPKFLYSSVWKDTSQFGDIYQEEYFLDYLKDDVDIVKELPPHLQALDVEAIGSQITDIEIMKEAMPSYYIEAILPILQRNGIVHFLGFGNRLGFDPLPPLLQRLRCKCNFHALKFVPKIQKLGSMLVQRIRNHKSKLTEIDKQLFGKYMPSYEPAIRNRNLKRPVKYLALHMRFEVDMVAYSLCDFGGGQRERLELQMYREEHFPTLITRIQNISISPEELRISGKCPLTPEEAALMLSALGYTSETYIYLAGSHIYGGLSRLQPFMQLFPNVVTKEDLLSPEELEPFKNFSSQLAALDFIACASSDVFAMTDTGSQLSSLVTGYRIYHGRGQASTLRPNKKRFARILTEHADIDWGEFQKRVQNMIEENQGVTPRGRGRSVYRLPRTPGCMCKTR